MGGVPLWADDDQYFTHVDPATGTARHFSVARMLRAAIDAQAAGRDDVEVLSFELDGDFARACVESRGVDVDRVARLTPAELALPLIAVEEADGTTLMVDGHHRYVRLYLDRAPEGVMFRFKRGSWERLVVDLPPAVSRILVQDVLPPDTPAHSG